MRQDSSKIEHEEIEQMLTDISVMEIREPEEATNKRGNPEVEVEIRRQERVIERYSFEFVCPPEREDYPRYRIGPYKSSEGARESKHRNEATFKAATALAEDTGMPVETLVHPTEELESGEE